MEEKTRHTRKKATSPLKVVLFGPESTGKTTLAKLLAEHYQTEWVPEYMREYLERKWELKKEMISKEDLIPIANGQLKSEQEALKRVDSLLLCDTDLLEIKVYSEYYYDGFCPKEIVERATINKPDIYLLMYIDTVWEADMLRDRPNNREEMFEIFENELISHNLPYTKLIGDKEERFKRAVQIIDNLRNEKNK